MVFEVDGDGVGDGVGWRVRDGGCGMGRGMDKGDMYGREMEGRETETERWEGGGGGAAEDGGRNVVFCHGLLMIGVTGALTQIMFAKALMRLGEGLGSREGEWNETGRKPVDKRCVDT